MQYGRSRPRLKAQTSTKLATRLVRSVSTGVAALLVLAACSSSGSDGSTTPAASQGTAAGAAGQQDLRSLLPKKILDSGTLVVGTNATVPPTIYFGSDGKTLEGLIPDLADALAKELGLKVRWENATFDSLLAGVNSGRYDIAFANMGDFLKREKANTFVDYEWAGWTFMAKKGTNVNAKVTVDQLTEFCGLTVSVYRGSSQQARAEDLAKSCTTEGKSALKVEVLQDAQTAVLAVQSGRADLYLGDQNDINWLVGQDNSEYKQVGPLPRAGIQGIAAARDNHGLVAALHGAMQKLMDSGEYMQILTKWKQENTGMDVAMVNAGGLIHP